MRRKVSEGDSRLSKHPLHENARYPRFDGFGSAAISSRPGRNDASSADKIRECGAISRGEAGHLLDRSAERCDAGPARAPRSSAETPQGGVAEKEAIMKNAAGTPVEKRGQSSFWTKMMTVPF